MITLPTTEEEVLDTRCCGPQGCGEERPIDPDEPEGAKARFCIGDACMGLRISTRGAPYCGLAGKPLEG